jgi:anthranilate/para-aminobenzoate synthase component I
MLESPTRVLTTYTSEDLVRGLLKLSETEHVSLLDSCDRGDLGSQRIIAGIRPVETVELRGGDPEAALRRLAELVEGPRPVVFTISYELGAKLNGITARWSEEPDVFAAVFDTLIVCDPNGGGVMGNFRPGDMTATDLAALGKDFVSRAPSTRAWAGSNFSRNDYLEAVETIRERIRSGDTYQTNLTQQIRVDGTGTIPQDVFYRLRYDHPAAFSAFITRGDSTVVSASPERFFRIGPGKWRHGLTRRICTSPIKGTRHRGQTTEEDTALRNDLLKSAKDRAENTMIVDLLRNDLGRVCEYGSVSVDKLCELEVHPTLFHLVSTVSGDLRHDVGLADVIRALFPCGSITGAPKISTMRIIDGIEQTPRGLSMGAIGYSIPRGFGNIDPVIDLNVAIRTMVFRDGVATFNVGGGITIDSDPAAEYEESLLKAQALLAALNARLESRL